MRVASLVVAGLLAVAPSLGAQLPTGVTPSIYCPTGAASCFGMAMAFAPNGPGTALQLYLQVLQGTTDQTTTPFGLTGLWVGRYGNGAHGATIDPSRPAGYIDNGSPLVFGLDSDGAIPIGPVGDTGIRQASDWDNTTFPDMDGRYGFYITTAGMGLTVTGCDTPLTTDAYGNLTVPAYHYSTCPRDGLGGWMRFDLAFVLFNSDESINPRLLTADDLAVSLTMTTWGNGHGTGDVGCAFVGAASGFTAGDMVLPVCEARPYDLATTTPEPATLALVAPALLGLGMARRRTAVRRRG